MTLKQRVVRLERSSTPEVLTGPGLPFKGADWTDEELRAYLDGPTPELLEKGRLTYWGPPDPQVESMTDAQLEAYVKGETAV